MTTVFRNGRLPTGRAVDLTIDGGRIVAVDDHGHVPGDQSNVIELDGWLLLPPLAEPHAHLDKALTSEVVPNPTGDLTGAI